ncbi:MAG: cytochrome C biogenesis protein ResC [Nitrospirae bacterium GWC2_42_7]|nr:MAG: cytochrome C biogenesis protein ResC [Nitrospirae bacterium GWC2_42_7]
MNNPLFIDRAIHWLAVIIYVAASIVNTYGLIFRKERSEQTAYYIIVTGLFVHGIAIVYRWTIAGHGPYMVRYEVLSSNAWVALSTFLVFSRFFPKIRSASIFMFPAVFLLIALGLFFNPEVTKLPPSLKSIWLVLHVVFYKIAFGTILIAFALSVFYILRNRTKIKWSERFPDNETLDIYAYRFAGFGFTFWSIGMLAGSIWAYQSWGRFWGWDPVETWSLITWISFGIYLHLRRFFEWKDEKAALLFIFCFILSLISLFFIPILESSIHSEYFK